MSKSMIGGSSLSSLIVQCLYSGRIQTSSIVARNQGAHQLPANVEAVMMFGLSLAFCRNPATSAKREERPKLTQQFESGKNVSLNLTIETTAPSTTIPRSQTSADRLKRIEHMFTCSADRLLRLAKDCLLVDQRGSSAGPINYGKG